MNEIQMTNEMIIKPIKGFVRIDFKELWRYRELLFIFTWRDLKVRYKQTLLGASWAIIQPLMMMIVFSAFFGNFVEMPSDGIPYPIFVFTGLLIWNYFSLSVTNAGNSMVAHQQMIQKIYFPRLTIPISSTLAGLVDFAIASIILVGLMIYYGYVPSLIGILLIPVLLLITFTSALGLGLLFSAVNVKYRDIRYALPFFIRILMFLSPVIYPVSIAKGSKWEWILWANPMSGVIENARAGILGTGDINWQLLAVSGLVSIVMFIIGIYYFRRTEKDFADII